MKFTGKYLQRGHRVETGAFPVGGHFEEWSDSLRQKSRNQVVRSSADGSANTTIYCALAI